MNPRDGGKEERRGREEKAREFADAAELFFDETTGAVDSSDAYVMLAVHAGQGFPCLERASSDKNGVPPRLGNPDS